MPGLIKISGIRKTGQRSLFLSKSQLAKDGLSSVSVVIPALSPTLDKSLKEDCSLFPVRALRYYHDNIHDLRQNKDVVFQEGFQQRYFPCYILD